MITADQIKPKERGKSDFFSWQLYRWVKKYPNRLTIWSATWNSCTGIDQNKRTLYIGDKRDGSWIHARQLRNLCLAGQKIEDYAYGGGHDTKNWVEVTDQFWNEYLEKGVCAIHKNAHIFLTNNDKRECRRCGYKEKQIIEMVERKRWVSTA